MDHSNLFVELSLKFKRERNTQQHLYAPRGWEMFFEWLTDWVKRCIRVLILHRFGLLSCI